MCIASLTLVSAPSAQGAGVTWCWSMQLNTLRGTFTTDGTAPGDGTAPSGTYNLTGASVYETAYADIEVGAIANNTYAFGGQPSYQIIWNGAEVTGFYRDSGALTNGFGIFNGPGDSGAYLLFDIDSQSAQPPYIPTSPPVFSTNVTPSLFPQPAGGQCPGEPSPSTSTDSGGPLDVLEQYGRTIDASCRDGWGPSWAQWPNDYSGGWVCTRTLYYDAATATWLVR